MDAHDHALAERLLDTALRLGEQHGWETLHLHQIADAEGVRLADIHRCYQQKDDLVEAWFDRADQAMLQTAASSLNPLNPRQRLEQLLLNWFAAVAPHRTLTRQMLAYKLELGHVHLQVGGLLRISRTVQWWSEAASREHTDLARILDEVSLSSIFVSSFLLFLNDDSAEQQRTRDYLKTALFVQDGLAQAAQRDPLQAIWQFVNQTWTR